MKRRPTPLTIINALSFHKIDTDSQPTMPASDSIKSQRARPSIPLIDIPPKSMTEEIHLRYQSRVYLGVADLNILAEFSISSGVNLG